MEMEMEKDKKRGRYMDDDLKVLLLPEIITEILSRLPADSAIGCRLICKQWRSLIDHPSFVDTHTSQVISSSSTSNPKKFGNHLIPNSCASSYGFFLCAQQDSNSFKLELIEYNDGSCGEDEKSVLEFKPSKPITGHPFHFIGDNWGTIMISSCNGLVFMGSTKPNYNNDMFICNFFTREYLNLRTAMPIKEEERQLRRSTMKAYMTYGFGYHPYTNEYKIVSIYYDDMLNFGKGEVSVYTLGSGKWRNKGEIPYWLFNVCYPGVFANGAIHWFDHKNTIVSFDLVDEEFRVVAPKIQPAPNYFDQFGVLGGCLCVTRSDITRCDESPKDIWVLNVLTTDHNNSEAEEEEEFSWNKKFSIPGKGMRCKAAPQVVLKSGKILLRGGTGLVSFDPKTEAFVEDEGNIFPCDYKVKIIPHTKSFVSLKALGEKDAKCFGRLFPMLRSLHNRSLHNRSSNNRVSLRSSASK